MHEGHWRYRSLSLAASQHGQLPHPVVEEHDTSTSLVVDELPIECSSVFVKRSRMMGGSTFAQRRKHALPSVMGVSPFGPHPMFTRRNRDTPLARTERFGEAACNLRDAQSHCFFARATIR